MSPLVYFVRFLSCLHTNCECYLLCAKIQQEDEKVIELVRKYGPKKWTLIAKHLDGRIGKQCRERWHNHLNPEIIKTAWTDDEEMMIIKVGSDSN